MASMSQESRDPPWPVIQNLAQEELTLHAKAHHLESIPGRSKRILAATCKGSAICYASMCFSFLEFLQLRSKPYQYGTVITEVPPRFLAPNQLSSRAQFMENIRRGWILLVHLVKCPVPQADSRMGSFRITFGTKNANTSPKFNWETKCCKAFTSCLPTSWKDFILDVNPRLLPWQASSPKVRLLFFEDSSHSLTQDLNQNLGWYTADPADSPTISLPKVPDFPLFSPLFSEEGKHFVKEIIAHTISYSKVSGNWSEIGHSKCFKEF